jgi:hypothetical protein
MLTHCTAETVLRGDRTHQGHAQLLHNALLTIPNLVF